MLEYDRIDNSEGIDNTRNKLVSKECWMCHFWFFIDKNFNFDDRLCNGCRDINMKAVSFNNLAIVYVDNKVYRINFAFMTKDDAIKKLYASSYYDVRINKYGVKVGTSLRFWENKGWINSIDPYGWFHWYCRYWLGRRSSDASNTSRANEMSEDERQIKRWRAIANRFKSVLVKMIKDKGAKFDDYSVSPKIRQILLHWGYELVKSDCF